MMINIQLFEPKYTDAVIRLILNIQQNEFGVPVTIDDQKDLLDIKGFYQHQKGNFWIALYKGELVGTIALADMGNGQAALRKMFVKENFRGGGYGVASLLLTTLVEWAKQKNIHALYLGTVDVLKAAHRFYEKNGFTLLAKESLPAEFPLMEVDTRFYEHHF